MKRVNYNGLIVDIRDEDLKEAIAVLSSESTNARLQIVKSADDALKKVMKTVEEHKPLSPKTLQNTANDICIWFANETLEGRAEQYRATIQ